MGIKWKLRPCKKNRWHQRLLSFFPPLNSWGRRKNSIFCASWNWQLSRRKTGKTGQNTHGLRVEDIFVPRELCGFTVHLWGFSLMVEKHWETILKRFPNIPHMPPDVWKNDANSRYNKGPNLRTSWYHGQWNEQMPKNMSHAETKTLPFQPGFHCSCPGCQSNLPEHRLAAQRQRWHRFGGHTAYGMLFVLFRCVTVSRSLVIIVSVCTVVVLYASKNTYDV